jgi:hypothetical protein
MPLELEQAMASLDAGDAPSAVSLLRWSSDASAGEARLDEDAAHDLFLDQVIDRLARGRLNQRARELFAQPLTDPDAICYRQEVFRDLQATEALEALTRFSDGMQSVRSRLAGIPGLRYAQEREHWQLQAVRRYVEAVATFAADLGHLPLRSRALTAARDEVGRYVDSAEFRTLAKDVDGVRAKLAAVRYKLRILGGAVQVSRVVESETDYTEDVLATFARFREHEAKSYLFRIQDEGSMNHVEAAIAGYVARLHPEEFAALHDFCERHLQFLDPLVAALHRDAQFYLGYLDLVRELGPLGVEFCLPEVSTEGTLAIERGVDLALALNALGSNTRARLVPNDCRLAADERLLVVTGPNQGGKTTYARMLGQIHHLAMLGVPVPAASARVPMTDQIRTLFERGENLADLRGHLYDDLVRAHAILRSARPQSLVILNEVFSSTSLEDALLLGREVLLVLEASGSRSVCVTFFDELAELTPDTVSAVASVEADDPTRRTFEIVRRPADGRAYASALAEKYRVDYDAITKRLDGRRTDR